MAGAFADADAISQVAADHGYREYFYQQIGVLMDSNAELKERVQWVMSKAGREEELEVKVKVEKGAQEVGKGAQEVVEVEEDEWKAAGARKRGKRRSSPAVEEEEEEEGEPIAKRLRTRAAARVESSPEEESGDDAPAETGDEVDERVERELAVVRKCKLVK